MTTRVFALAVLLFGELAVAEEPVSRSAISADMLNYYGGERSSAYFVLVHGVASAGLGSYLLANNNPSEFDRGLAYTLWSVSALELLGGISYAVQCNREISQYGGELAADPVKFKEDELAHIDGTRSRFIYYRMFEAAISLAGVGFLTYGLAADRDTSKGIGLGLAATGIPLLVMDTINNDRAAGYVERLRAFNPSVAIQRDGSFTFGIASRF
ncbi:MAG: hypothetical protein ACJ790_12990 [Myxococcaceae bacterium]